MSKEKGKKRKKADWSSFEFLSLPRTPLHYAAASRHYQCLETLLACGTAINATDQWGRSALHYAAASDLDRRWARLQKLYIKLQLLLPFFFLLLSSYMLNLVVKLLAFSIQSYLIIFISFFKILCSLDEFKSKMLCCRQLLGGLCDSLDASLCFQRHCRCITCICIETVYVWLLYYNDKYWCWSVYK